MERCRVAIVEDAGGLAKVLGRVRFKASQLDEADLILLEAQIDAILAGRQVRRREPLPLPRALA